MTEISLVRRRRRSVDEVKSIVKTLIREEKDISVDRLNFNYQENNPHITNMATRSAIFYTLAQGFDPVDVRDAVHEIVSDLPLSYLVDGSNWLNLTDCVHIMENCCNVMRHTASSEVRHDIKEMGFSVLELDSINKSLLHFSYVMGGTQRILKNILFFSRYFNKYMKHTPEETEEGIIITAKYTIPELLKNTRCEWEEGLYEMIPTAFGYERWNVEQIKCARHSNMTMETPECKYFIPLEEIVDKHSHLIPRIRRMISRTVSNSKLSRELRASIQAQRDDIDESLSDNIKQNKELKRRNSIFSMYVPSGDARDKILSSPCGIVPGKILIAAYLFADIRGFTSLAEANIDNPHLVVDFVNYYLKSIRTAILKNDGHFYNFMGDGLLAAFPQSDRWQYADKAVLAAIEFQRSVSSINESDEFSAFKPLNVGLGINSNPSIVGTITTETDAQYSLIGDAVNLASRVESFTKDYGVDILFSGEFISNFVERGKMGDGCLYLRRYPVGIRKIDTRIAKGRTIPTVLYECYAHQTEEIRIAKLETHERLEDALEKNIVTRFKNLQRDYKKLTDGETDPVVDYHIRRLS